MEGLMTNGILPPQPILPPPCPNCAGTTALKETHKLAHGDGLMYFFFCTPCALEYPKPLSAADIKDPPGSGGQPMA
jgi:hypothetical protein